MENMAELIEYIRNKLVTNNLSLSTAESCTGGYLAHLITMVPYASKIYKGGAVVYSPKAKELLLNIKAQDILTYGEVSGEVAELMAKKIQLQLKSTFALATTGYAGPSGGDIKNPLGTVYIALATTRSVLIEKLFYNNKSRADIIHLSSIESLKLLAKQL